MYINLRSAQIAGDPGAAMGFAVDIAETVEEATGVSVSVWTGLFGVPMGTVSWSSQVESFSTLATLGQKLGESAAYNDKVAAATKAGLFVVGSLQNRLLNVVHQAGTPGPFQFVSSLTATADAGKVAEAMAFGVEVSDFVSGLTGSAVSFAANTFADVGSLSWIAGYADAAAVDAAQAAIAGSAEYMERTKAAGELFVPATGAMALAERVK
jgi:hypothetical protein